MDTPTLNASPHPVLVAVGSGTSDRHYGDCHVYVRADHANHTFAANQLAAASTHSSKVQRSERRADFGGLVYQLVFARPLAPEETKNIVEHVLHPWKVHFVEE
jgi:hypothetical protein